MKMGVMANAAQSLEAETAALVANELGHNVKLVHESDVLKEIEEIYSEPVNKPSPENKP